MQKHLFTLAFISSAHSVLNRGVIDGVSLSYWHMGGKLKTTTKASEMYKHVHFVPHKPGDQLQAGRGSAPCVSHSLRTSGPACMFASHLHSRGASAFQTGRICVIFH